MGLTALLDTIYGFYCTISTNFYFYLQYFHFNKIQQNKRYPNTTLRILTNERERERERCKWGGWVIQQTFNSYIERSLGEDTIIIEG